MPELQKCYKIEVLVDAPLVQRIRRLAAERGIRSYRLQSTLGGTEDGGRWRDDQVTGGAGSKVLLIAIVTAVESDRFLEVLSPLVYELSLVVTRSAVESLS
mgnify:CR=1 FL=1